MNGVLNQVYSNSLPAKSSTQLWLEKREDWVGVPISEADDFISCVLQLTEHNGDRELLGVFLDTYSDKPIAFAVPANAGGISEFNVEPPPALKVLFAGAPDWIFLMIESDFYVVIGSIRAVEKSLDLSIDQAFTKFNVSIESWKFPAQLAARLQPLKNVPRTVYRNTLERYQNASVGSRVNLFEPRATT